MKTTRIAVGLFLMAVPTFSQTQETKTWTPEELNQFYSTVQKLVPDCDAIWPTMRLVITGQKLSISKVEDIVQPLHQIEHCQGTVTDAQGVLFKEQAKNKCKYRKDRPLIEAMLNDAVFEASFRLYGFMNFVNLTMTELLSVAHERFESDLQQQYQELVTRYNRLARDAAP